MEAGGFLYLCDSYADDLPYWIKGAGGKPHLIIPYTLDANDMRFINPQGFGGGEQFFTYLKDSFDVLYAEGETSPKMMSVGLHCRLVGRPGRAAALMRFLDYIGKHDRVWVPTRLADRPALARQPRASGAQTRPRSDKAMSQIALSDLNAAEQRRFRRRARQCLRIFAVDRRAGGRSRPFAGVNAAVRRDEGGDRERRAEVRLALIRAHPDLANKTQRAAGLTAESNAEQNSAGLDRLSDAEYEAFERVNNAYRAKFGFPYIVCVRRHTKDSDPARFRARLPNDRADRDADVDRGDLPDRGAAARSARRRRRRLEGARAAVDPCARQPQRQARARELRSSSSSSPISARAA